MSADESSADPSLPLQELTLAGGQRLSRSVHFAAGSGPAGGWGEQAEDARWQMDGSNQSIGENIHRSSHLKVCVTSTGIGFCYYKSSVADPGCFIPDPTIAPSRIRIPDPGGKKAPDPGSDLFLYKGY
jgi:hypothetical protein